MGRRFGVNDHLHLQGKITRNILWSRFQRMTHAAWPLLMVHYLFSHHGTFQKTMQVHRVSIKKSIDGTNRDRYNGISLWVNNVQTSELTRTDYGFQRTDEDQGDFVNFDHFEANVKSVQLKFSGPAVVHEIYIFYSES